MTSNEKKLNEDAYEAYKDVPLNYTKSSESIKNKMPMIVDEPI